VSGCGYKKIATLLPKRQPEQKQILNETVIQYVIALPTPASLYNGGR
jgi:hypothetical protein